MSGAPGNTCTDRRKDVQPPHMTDYGVCASQAPNDPEAYDLNTERSRGRCPMDIFHDSIGGGGEHRRRRRAHGIVVTRAVGLPPCNDGKVRAYDEDTGDVLWTGTIGGTTSGVPVSYEAKGRQYFVIMTNPGGGGRGGNAPSASRDPSVPTGAIAFALPKKE